LTSGTYTSVENVVLSFRTIAATTVTIARPTIFHRPGSPSE
jgi:hypothetical protein